MGEVLSAGNLGIIFGLPDLLRKIDSGKQTYNMTVIIKAHPTIYHCLKVQIPLGKNA